jgi:hypothetical protein
MNTMATVESLKAKCMTFTYELGARAALETERAELQAEYVAWKARLDDASDALSACYQNAGFRVSFGCYVVPVKSELWRFLAVAEATRALETIRDEDRAYWAQSRLRDLDRVLGTYTGQPSLF